MQSLNLNQEPTYIDITFLKGIPTKINGKEFNMTGIHNVLGSIADEYGISSVDTILADAAKTVHSATGDVCMKFVSGKAVPFTA